MGKTLGWRTDLDQHKTTVSGTLGAPPTQTRRTVLSTEDTTPPTGVTGRRRDPRVAKGASQDDCHARRHALQRTSNSNCPLHTLDSGRRRRLLRFPYMYCAPPCVYKRGRRASSQAISPRPNTRNSQHTHTRSPKHNIGTCLNHLLL